MTNDLSIFHVFIGLSYIFREMSQILAHFLNWIILLLSCKGSSYIQGTIPLSDLWLPKAGCRLSPTAGGAYSAASDL